MYAHQVIEDINNNRIYSMGDVTDFSDYNKGVDVSVKLIKQAVCFNLGHLPKDNLPDFFKPIKKNSLFSGGEDCLLLPFDVCYFDFSCDCVTGDDTSRMAAVVTQHGNDKNMGLELHMFKYLKSFKKWEMEICKIKITKKNMMRKVFIAVRSDINIIPQYTLTMVSRALTLLNCKNITTQTTLPPLKLNKKRIKSGKQPLFTYKTLVIKPTGKKQESQQSQGLWDNRIHLCRGHFKEYTAEKPLFGRITGRFWWQPSVRGNKEKGVVIKDYKVEIAN
jgi:hypothetical protein